MKKSAHSDPTTPRHGEGVVLDEILALLLFFVLSVNLLLQVISRYVVNAPMGWTEEISRYLLVLLSFIGSAIGFRKGSHLSFLYLQNIFSKKVRQTSEIFLTCISGGLLIFLTFSSFHIAQALKPFQATSLSVSISVLYYAVFLSLLFCSVRCFLFAWHRYKDLCHNDKQIAKNGANKE